MHSQDPTARPREDLIPTIGGSGAERLSVWIFINHPCPHAAGGRHKGVCVYYCSTYYKAVRVGEGIVEDMCYERRRAKALVD